MRNIRDERQKRGWTLEYVGKQIGLKKGTMSDIETGRRMPSFKYLIALCKLFEVPCEEIEWIFADSDSETNTNDSTKRTKNKEK